MRSRSAVAVGVQLSAWNARLAMIGPFLFFFGIARRRRRPALRVGHAPRHPRQSGLPLSATVGECSALQPCSGRPFLLCRSCVSAGGLGALLGLKRRHGFACRVVDGEHVRRWRTVPINNGPARKWRPARKCARDNRYRAITIYSPRLHEMSRRKCHARWRLRWREGRRLVSLRPEALR